MQHGSSPNKSMDVGKNFQSIVSRENIVKHFFDGLCLPKTFFSLVISFRTYNLIMDNQKPANPVEYLRWNLFTENSILDVHGF